MSTLLFSRKSKGEQLLTRHRWEKLNLVRVYTKPKGRMPDYSAPVVLRSSKCTVEDFVSAYLPRVSNNKRTDSFPV